MVDSSPAELPTSTSEVAAPWLALHTVARLLRITDAEVLARAGRRELLAVPTPGGGALLPTGQLADAGVVRGLHAVLDALVESLGEDPREWAAWLGAPGPFAERRRWDELADDPAAVLEEARRATVTWESDSEE